MAFDTGRASFRLFYLQASYDSSLVEKFAEHVALPVTAIKVDPIEGWVTGRYLLDRSITDERCVIGPYVSVQLLRAEKKVPGSLLNANVKMEEEAELKARGTDRLPRKAKAEVKQRVLASLLPQMPPTLSGIPLVVDLRNQRLLAGALSDSQIDRLTHAFHETAGETPILVTPGTAALKRRKVNENDLEPVSFSPDETLDPPQEGTLGMDFFTWLWFRWEKEGGTLHLPDGREVGYMLEGPLTFYREGQGAHEAVLRKGMPLNSREAGTALMCGKKLKRAKLTVAEGDSMMSASMDADFVFRSIKLPKSEQMEAEGRFEERMTQIETFCETWFTLFDNFLDLRTSAKQWPKTVAAMQEWIQHIGTASEDLEEK